MIYNLQINPQLRMDQATLQAPLKSKLQFVSSVCLFSLFFIFIGKSISPGFFAILQRYFSKNFPRAMNTSKYSTNIPIEMLALTRDNLSLKNLYAQLRFYRQMTPKRISINQKSKPKQIEPEIMNADCLSLLSLLSWL